MSRRAMVFFATLALPLASAQASVTTVESGVSGSSVTVNPSVPSFVLNADACNRTAADITITVTNTALNLGATGTLWIWWASGASCTINTTQINADLIATQALGANEPLITSTPFTFPTDLNTPPTFTTQTVLDKKSACTETGVDKGQAYICIAVDLSTGATAGTIEAGEPWAWVKIPVDTVGPTTPAAPEVTGHDGSLELKGNVTTGADRADVSGWEAKVRPAKLENGLPVVSDCLDWGDAIDARVDSDANISVSGLENGTLYEACMFAVDAMGNLSDPSPLGYGTPLAQCDFYECYPEDQLKTGYCGAATAPAWAILLAALAAARGRRRARSGRPS